MHVAEFDYDLPPALIAQYPPESREQSRLLVVNRANAALISTTFAHLPEYLKPSDVLVVNDTKVIPARLQGRKQPTGGKIEILLVRPLHENIWEVLIGGKTRPGTNIVFGDGKLACTVWEKDETGRGIVEFAPKANLPALFAEIGETPLPPYIKRPQGVLSADPARYQTVYAKHDGAVAAPTAGLHFSESLLDQIKAKGVELVTVTLHVGPGTFQPVKVEQVEEHHIPPEWYELSAPAAQTLNHALHAGRRIIAVGTTTTRLLEMVHRKYHALQADRGWADLFIYPGFRFQVAQALITNFHLPKSSLLMLVSAFGGLDLIRRAYQEAIAQQYRFYSYGDAMLLI